MNSVGKKKPKKATPPSNSSGEGNKEIHPGIGELLTHRAGPKVTLYLVNLAAFIIVIAGIKAASDIFVPFILSIFVAVACGPFLFFLQKQGVPKALALLTVLISILGLGVGVGTFIGSSINDFTNKLPGYQADLTKRTELMINKVEDTALVKKLTDLFKKEADNQEESDVPTDESPEEPGTESEPRMEADTAKPPPLPDLHPKPTLQEKKVAPTDPARLVAESLANLFSPGSALRLVGNTLKGLGGVMTNTFLILLTVAFILLEASSFPVKLQAILGKKADSLAPFQRFTVTMKRYIAIKTAISLTTGFLIAIGLSILGVDYAMLFGLIAFLLNYVPNIGSIIAAVPAVLLAIIQLSMWQAMFVAMLFMAINVIMGNILEPRLMGKGVGLSTLVVFLSLVFWGWVLGPVGMLLSVPLTMTVKIALDSFEETRWLSILLGPEPVGLAKKAKS